MEAVQAAAAQFRQYSAAGQSGSSESIDSQQQRAWNDYLSNLSKHGWTQYNVPDRYRSKVLRQVQAKVAVPNDWDFSDEKTFKDAVAHRVESRSAVHGNNVSYHGKAIPVGLSWPAFFVYPVVQEELLGKLGLPRSVVLQADYRSADTFEHDVFTPLLDGYAKRQLAVYEAPVDSFANGAVNAEWARGVARAAIVPPVALFFSLLGAIGHICKLSFLSLKVLAQWLAPRDYHVPYLWVAPLLILVVIAGLLHTQENAVTRSRLYAYLQQQVVKGGDFWSHMAVSGAHAVAVGQGACYPFDEMLRTRVLGGISFGYTPAVAAPRTH